MKTCPNCSKEMPSWVNYCSWNCGIELCRKDGGREFTPNGLPIKSIRWDGLMLEHSHGDHPDYKFPISAMRVNRIPVDENGLNENHETHALIYTDGHVAVSLYEGCYSIWSVGSGKSLGGWNNRHEWALDGKSLKKLRELGDAVLLDAFKHPNAPPPRD